MFYFKNSPMLARNMAPLLYWKVLEKYKENDKWKQKKLGVVANSGLSMKMMVQWVMLLLRNRGRSFGTDETYSWETYPEFSWWRASYSRWWLSEITLSRSTSIFVGIGMFFEMMLELFVVFFVCSIRREGCMKYSHVGSQMQEHN